MHRTTYLRPLILLATLAIVVLSCLPQAAPRTARAMPGSVSAATTATAYRQPCPEMLAYKSCLGLMPPAYGMSASAPETASVSGAPDVPFLQPAASTPTGSWPQVLTAAPLVDSGRATAAVATDRYFDAANDRQLHLFDMPGGTFVRSQQLAGGADPEAAVTLDANLDGQPDVVVALAGDNSLAVYNHGITQPLSDAMRLPAFGGPDALAVGDFNGDLRFDLAAVAPLSDTIRFWRSSAQGLQPLPLTLAHPTDGFDALTVGDFNSDGQDDLAALRGAGYANNSVVIYLQAHGTFPISYTLSPNTGGYLPNSLAAGDINGDGRDDLVVSAGGNVPNALLNVFIQHVKDAAAILPSYELTQVPVTYTAYHLPSAITIGDLNHDGLDDVTLLNDAWRTLSVYTQTSTAQLAPYAAADLPYTSHYRPGALTLADFDGNGGLDVALVGREAGLTVLKSKLPAPTATITQPLEAARLAPGPVTIVGTAGPTATRVQARIRGLTGWTDASLNGGIWQLAVTFPIQQRAWWIEARAIDAQGLVQAPPARRRVLVEIACYAVADNDGVTSSPDRFMLIDMATAHERLIGDTGTEHIEALSFRPGSTLLYAANAKQLGTLDLSSGVFSPATHVFGKGSGARGKITFNDVDGLAFGRDGTLYATHRRDDRGDKDVLFKADPGTGQHIADAFGPNVAYVEIKGSGVPEDIDDIAFDPTSGLLYGVANKDHKDNVLITIDPQTGTASVVGRLSVDDVEGMAFTSDGQLYATTGKGGSSTTRNHLYAVDKLTGAVTPIGPFTDQRDYESMACPPANVPLPSPLGPQAPYVDWFVINGEASATTDAAITLDARSSDLSHGGVRWMLFMEYTYDAETNAWKLRQPDHVQSTDWQAYADPTTHYSWQIQSPAGVTYLQGWAANAAGQISSFPYQAFINYIPPSDTLAQGQTRVYRYKLNAGQTLTARLSSLQGDADLYLWSHNPDTVVPWFSNLSNATDEISIIAPADGMYQIEVFGYTSVTYQLTVDIVVGTGASNTLDRIRGVDLAKTLPDGPVVPLDSTPDIHQSPLIGPSIWHNIYLPIVHH